MGIKLERVKAGPSAQLTHEGMETIIAMHPDAVIAAGEALALWTPQAEQLLEEGVYIVTDGVSGAEELGIEAVISGKASNQRTGKLLANYIPAKMNPEANISIYRIPELDSVTKSPKSSPKN